ncbi:unnamed protein product [Aureobasidium vineae]|uniref:Uncharacterized protein n=1 Tax=Aureobasidium vineae TaxID=2773715 RepID=A0A9N8JJ65_9PEZI|nr:unnamed protein product [Aureobasidium vineae]
MCLIKRVTTIHPDDYSDTTETFSPCSHSVNNRPCDNTILDKITERVPSTSSQVALRPSSSRHNEVVLHQEPPRRRQDPREERRYSGEIGVRFRGWLKSPEFSIRRLDDGGSGSGSRRRRGSGESRRISGEMMPEAPMPPSPALVHQSNRRSPPPSMPPTLISPPSRPTPPQGPAGAAAAFTTRDTIPSSSSTPSRTSSSRSRDAYRAVQGLPHLTVPASSSSVTSRYPRSTPGLSRIRFDPSTKFRDSAYGSSNISPIDAPKANTLSDTRSNTASERSASERYNYTNDNAVARREDYDIDEEDKKSNSSEGHAGSYEGGRGVPEPDERAGSWID